MYLTRMHIRSLSRSGQPYSNIWITKLNTWVQAWDEADEHMTDNTGPHTEASFRAYLSWYAPKTRCRLTYAETQPQPHVATSQDGYARHRDEELAGAVSLHSKYFNSLITSTLGPKYISRMQFELCRIIATDASAHLMRLRGGSQMSMVEQTEAWNRTRDHARSCLHAFGSRTDYEDSNISSQASSSFPCGPTVQQSPSQPVPQPFWPQQFYPGTDNLS